MSLTSKSQPCRSDAPSPNSGQGVLGLAAVLLVRVVRGGVVDEQGAGLEEGVLAPGLLFRIDLDGRPLLMKPACHTDIVPHSLRHFAPEKRTRAIS